MELDQWFCVTRGLLLGLVIALPATGAGAGDSAVANLIGTWSGAGEAQLDNGKTEPMRCKGYYTAQGDDGLGIAIRCANASARIDLRATLAFANGAVTGNWEERTYNAAGSVTGKARSDKVDLAITGGGLSASMAVAIKGGSQSVSIKAEGSGLKGVQITMTRGS